MNILSSKQIAEVDKATIAINKITSTELMEHAATLCFQWLHTQLKRENVKIYIFCGIGNNGGDGLVIARLLQQHGYQVHCFIVNFSEKRSDDFLVNYNRLKELGEWPTIINGKNDFPEIAQDDIVIDSIFGNGLTRAPKHFTKQLIQHINNSKAFILAIDIPSGLYADTSITDTDSVIKAEHTLTFQTPKLAFLLPDNKDFVNTWEVIDIGLDLNFIESLKPKIHFITETDVKQLYIPRCKWGHKGTYGHSLIIGGSFGKIGAISLASKAALKIGSGLVTAYLPKCGYNILQASVPEVMVEVDSNNCLEFFNFKTKATVIGIGPGMGTSEKTAAGFNKFIKENKLPLVIDADAINLLAQNNSLFKFIPENSILTPHPKELERLIGKWKDDFDKLQKTIQFSITYKIIVVLKGTYTVIIHGENIYFNSSGNVALATAGSGDVLTGLITGLIAQGYSPLNASIFGVFLHGSTANIGVTETGYETFTATSILKYLPNALLDLFKEKVEEGQDEDEASNE